MAPRGVYDIIGRVFYFRASQILKRGVSPDMPAYLLLAFAENSVDLVVAHSADLDSLRIESSYSFDLRLSDLPASQAETKGEKSPVETEELIKDEQGKTACLEQIRAIIEKLGDDFELLPVILCSPMISFHTLDLPFKESSRLAQIVPSQIQDNVPFDLDEFLCACSALRSEREGGYQILATLAPIREIAQIIAFLQSFQLEPKVITTTSVALSCLPKVVYSYWQDLSNNDRLDHENPDSADNHRNKLLDIGLCAVIGITNQICSIALLKDGEPYDFREIAIEGLDDQEVVSEISAFIEGTRAKTSNPQTVILSTLPQKHSVNHVLLKLGYDIRAVLMADFFKTSNHIAHDPSELAWAISLLLAETQSLEEEAGQIVNLRTGPFVYHPAFENVVSALKEESFWFAMAALCLFFWIGVHIYIQSSQLNTLNDQMASNISTIFEGEKSPQNGELAFVEDRLSQLEDQLRGLGSISSLSPLESLRELSETIGPGIDIEVDTLNIGYSKISFRGSVTDFPSVGLLSSALEKNTAKFCKAKVDSAGRDTGSNRVKYSAEIELCE